jgi:PAS domain S-box-containing protein
VFAKDTESRFVITNVFHLKSLGASSLQDVIGKTDFDFFPREIAQKYYDDEQQVMRTGQAMIDQDERMLDPQGREHWLLTTKTPLRDSVGRITGIVGISRDITARKRNENELAQHKHRLEEIVEARVAQTKELADRLALEVIERQHAQQKLQEEHDRLRVIMDNLSSCHLFIKDRESRFVMTNAYQMKLLGIAPLDQVVGKTDFDFFPREMAEKYFADEQAVMDSGKAIRNREEPCTDRTGKRLWLLTTKVPLTDVTGKVTGLVGLSLDITELKNAADALADERNLLRTLIDALPMRIFIKDLDCRLLIANKTGLVSASPEDVIGKTDFDFFPDELAQQFYDEEQSFLKGGASTFRRLYASKNDKGEESILDVFKCPLRNSKGDVIGLVGINTDVTELRKNETALRESQKRLESERNLLLTLIDNIPHDVYAKDTEGHFVVANACVARTMKAGCAKELAGKTDFDFYPEEQALRFRADEKNIIATEQPLVGKLEPKTDAHGKTLWIITTKLPLRDSDGRIEGIVGIGINDTARKIEEEKRHHLEEQLRQADKMKAIGQLAGGIAHDFNNQLMAIMGSAELIRVSPKEDTTENIDLILTASRRAADLTGKLLAFARKGRYQSVSVDMHKIIAEVVALLDRTIDKRIRIVLKLGALQAMVDGDPTQLQNTLLNIAINARDAMPDGGEITFSTAMETPDHACCWNHPHDLRPVPHILIGIADTGTGMDEETKKHVFEPFFTTKPTGAGTGMGLPAVYGTIRNHQGSVTFTSALGHGTEFRIWLPLSKTCESAESEKKADAVVKGTAHVLVAEDEAGVRRILKAILTSMGYRVTICNDGQDAVDFYKTSWHDVDLVILDMMMPRMDGSDAFLAMQAVNPSLRAILCSGYSMSGKVQKILDAGVKRFIQKPFHMSDLSRTITEVLKN